MKRHKLRLKYSESVFTLLTAYAAQRLTATAGCETRVNFAHDVPVKFGFKGPLDGTVSSRAMALGFYSDSSRNEYKNIYLEVKRGWRLTALYESIV
jgi:hypothetical protein